MENKKYGEVMHFAFFAANFGYTRQDYDALTPSERLFLLKAYEDRVVSGTELIAAAVANAVGNVLRKKNKRPKKLWKKRRKRADREQMRSAADIAEAIEQREGKRWVDMVYAANGIRCKRKDGNNDV